MHLNSSGEKVGGGNTVNKESEKTMEFTMFSKKFPTKHHFRFEDGKTVEVQPDGLDDYTMLNEPSFALDNSTEEGVDLIADLMEDLLEEEGFPSEIQLDIAFGYDKSVMEFFGSAAAAENWIATVVTHMQTYYHHPSLKTRINLQV